jgi:16S rRNA (guanine(966)-N(2))-methyltransferase RsmD
MSHRVIAGSARGHRLQLVPGDTTRPIQDKVKEALFNIIGPRIVGSLFFDMFAGTGAVGIEALSRGAERAMLCDMHHLAIKTIYRNLEATGLKEFADVHMVNIFDLLTQPPRPEQKFDYIYVAPPQYKRMWLDTLRALDNNPAWLQPYTTVIVQIHPREKEDVLFEHLRDYDERRYGHTLLWFFEALVDAPDDTDDSEPSNDTDTDTEE